MAKKTHLLGDQSELGSQINDAMTAWHEDRKEWSERAMRSIMLANAGGAVAAAAFIGAALGRQGLSLLAPPYLPLALACFVLGLALILGHSIYRYFWAEYRVWDLRRKKRDLWDNTKAVSRKSVKTERPPTRPQLWIIYISNGLGFLLFVAGVLFGLGAVLVLG